MHDIEALQSGAMVTGDVIGEDPVDDTPLEIPADRRRVVTEKLDLPVDALHIRYIKHKIDLQPEFQRQFVWDRIKASRLIESLLLNIPIPVIYVADDRGKYVVVDGQQRLTSVFAFLEEKLPDNSLFPLSGLQVLPELNGKKFTELDDSLQDTISNSALRLIVIKEESNPDVKLEIFERLNLGAVRLNDQELRNCMYRGPYNQLLVELAHNQHLRKILGSDRPHPRMADRQLILRFFAMCRNTHLRYKTPMKQFLNREMREHQNQSPSELAKLRGDFEKSIEMAWLVFGENAFRRYNPSVDGVHGGHWEGRSLNVGLWDTLLYIFAYYEKRQIVPIADAIREEFLDLMTYDQKFVEYITSSTDNMERVRYRADTWRQRMDVLIGTGTSGPRTFSRQLKKQLFDASPTCEICHQHIQHMDDSEVDHIQHYWRGGKTIPENARLTHRYCNRARGGRYPDIEVHAAGGVPGMGVNLDGIEPDHGTAKPATSAIMVNKGVGKAARPPKDPKPATIPQERMHFGKFVQAGKVLHEATYFKPELRLTTKRSRPIW
jgi:hypothetical protein